MKVIGPYWLSLYGILFFQYIFSFPQNKEMHPCLKEHVITCHGGYCLVNWLLSTLIKAEICTFFTTSIIKPTVIAKILFLQYCYILLCICYWLVKQKFRPKLGKENVNISSRLKFAFTVPPFHTFYTFSVESLIKSLHCLCILNWDWRKYQALSHWHLKCSIHCSRSHDLPLVNITANFHKLNQA